MSELVTSFHVTISIHAPSRERPSMGLNRMMFIKISIHAPSRERLMCRRDCYLNTLFQSTLPHGSDCGAHFNSWFYLHFNPRSLTGATWSCPGTGPRRDYFNPRSLTGATVNSFSFISRCSISIHAPSRERHLHTLIGRRLIRFQSTLPHGSDLQ